MELLARMWRHQLDPAGVTTGWFTNSRGAEGEKAIRRLKALGYVRQTSLPVYLTGDYGGIAYTPWEVTKAGIAIAKLLPPPSSEY
jgi:hypothetical protein